MRRYFTLAAIAAVSATSVSAMCHHFYVGAGASHMVGHHDATASGLDPNLGAGSYNRVSGINKNAAGAALILGYRAHMQSFVWGLEADYMFGNIDKTNLWREPGVTPSTTERVESKSGAWSGALILGFRKESVTAYIRLGFENRRFKASYSKDNGYGTYLSGSGFSKTAFAPGVGFDVKVSDRFTVGGEYRYASYGSTSRPGANVTAFGNVTTLNYSVRPRVSTYLLNVKYFFCM